ncbi:uncharacterized protein LOC130425707 [Triplophysa dalaica]|uniref:uncharacterized protein LOC130425707 n=1 Tax=Triplophysa dalaica TaxID=1582913 RepID=UPI0024E02301|nr:uncharacterized protein LOC130425707 [Triplophysa dalaica]
MTRLDQSSRRLSPRGWTEVARSRDAFGSSGFSHVSAKEKTDRESGYFSLGRAVGTRAVCDKGSPPPYRHSERGHPLPNNKSPEPKATIPFRNPGLGVPSERRTGEIENADLMNYPTQPLTPDPVDLSVEVEALAGPRSLSPTPFRQAESLSTSKRRVERNLPLSSYPTQRSSSLSRSSSPGRSFSSLRRGESSSHLNTLGFRSGSLARGREEVSGIPPRNGYAGGSQKNLRSLASTVGTVSSVSKSYMDPRGSSRNSENNSSPVSSMLNRGGTPARSGYAGGSQKNLRSLVSTVGTVNIVSKSYMASRGSLRNTENSMLNRSGSSPSRQSYDGPRQTSVWKSETSPSYEYSHERQSSPHSGRRYDARSQSPKGRKETDSSSNQIREGRRSASPVRKGYGTEKSSTSNGWCYKRESPPSSRKGYDTQIQASPKKAEVKRASRHSSPSRGHHQRPDQSSLSKTKSSPVNPARELKSRSSSPFRWGNDNPIQSFPLKSEIGRRSATLRQDPTGHAPLRTTVSDRTDSGSFVKETSKSQHESNPPLGHWGGSAHSLLSQSVSRGSSPTRNSSSHRSAPVAWETLQSVSKRSIVKLERDIQSSSPNRRPPVSQKQHTSSQSSMDSESSHLSAGSSGLHREEYTMMADLPKVKTVMQREGPSHLDRLKSQQRRELSLYKPASHCQSKAPNSDWDEVEEERDAGTMSRAHSPSSLHTQRASSPSPEQIHQNQSRSSEHKQKAHRPTVYFSCSVEQTDEESAQQARANIFI